MTSRIPRRALASLAAVTLLMVGAPAGAQTLLAEAPEVRAVAIEMDRPIKELEERIRRRPPVPDPDVADTAMVFHNTRRGAARVSCVARDASGRVVGRPVWVRVPGGGVRFLLASHLSRDLDFIGSATCRTTGHLLGTVVFLGVPFGNLRVVQGEGDSAALIRFPLVAHY